MFKVDYNPDVLSCLANLSSDEVFTPPALANEMLDLLPNKLLIGKIFQFVAKKRMRGQLTLHPRKYIKYCL